MHIDHFLNLCGLELQAQSQKVVGSNPASDMIGIFLRPAPTQGSTQAQ